LNYFHGIERYLAERVRRLKKGRKYGYIENIFERQMEAKDPKATSLSRIQTMNGESREQMDSL
jgi:hypothetical protein